jgi:hypothetical protein
LTANQNFAGICHGDSGGPVFNPRDRDRFLIGIVSAGHTNCSEATPTVCINVVYYTKWILNQMNNEERMAVLFTSPGFLVDFMVKRLIFITIIIIMKYCKNLFHILGLVYKFMTGKISIHRARISGYHPVEPT